MKHLLTICSGFLLAVFLLACGKGRNSTAEFTAIEYMKAAHQYDWMKMSHLLSPESLLDFKETIITSISRDDSIAFAHNHRLQQDTAMNYARSHETHALPPDSFFAGMLNVVEPTNKRPASLAVSPSFVCVGAVYEGDDTLHTIMRIYIDTPEGMLTAVTLLTLKRTNSQWRVILPEDIASKAYSRIQEYRLPPK